MGPGLADGKVEIIQPNPGGIQSLPGEGEYAIVGCICSLLTKQLNHAAKAGCVHVHKCTGLT